jgi:Ser/Thr protein kinase RdoA (MazF antagonist)
LPDLLEELLAGRAPQHALPIDDAERARYVETMAVFREVCDELALLPRTIDHADMHGTNVLADGTQARLVDWGDACIGHPFTSLLVPIEWVVRNVPTSEQAAAVVRLLDAYLEPWGDRADDRTAGLAMWVGYVARAVLNAAQSIGRAETDAADELHEVVTLLRIWHSKRALLDRPRELLLPMMPWLSG